MTRVSVLLMLLGPPLTTVLTVAAFMLLRFRADWSRKVAVAGALLGAASTATLLVGARYLSGRELPLETQSVPADMVTFAGMALLATLLAIVVAVIAGRRAANGR